MSDVRTIRVNALARVEGEGAASTFVCTMVKSKMYGLISMSPRGCSKRCSAVAHRGRPRHYGASAASALSHIR